MRARYKHERLHDRDRARHHRVQVADGNQVRYWCDSLGCTEAQLRESIQAVGESPASVRDFLKTLTQRGLF